ncbi:MAG: putative membrane protein [Chloroflexi bacterium]|jgi:integral membrane protein (TIGR01906 family)|nr:MAG: putative membrane protein [Chloroflexota bacterium]
MSTINVNGDNLRFLRFILATTFAFALLVFLITSNVRIAFSSITLMELQFERQSVSQTTGLTEGQLSEAAVQIKDYFNSKEELLAIIVTSNGISHPVFNGREVEHMRDVKHLLQSTYRIQEGMFLYLFAVSLLGFLIVGNDFARVVRKLLVQGVVFIFGAIVVAMGISLIEFDPLFRLFHEISFSNDLWLLDQRTSLLVRMFPQRFWLESTLLVAVATLGEATAIMLFLNLVKWWQISRDRIALRKKPQFL